MYGNAADVNAAVAGSCGSPCWSISIMVRMVVALFSRASITLCSVPMHGSNVGMFGAMARLPTHVEWGGGIGGLNRIIMWIRRKSMSRSRRKSTGRVRKDILTTVDDRPILIQRRNKTLRVCFENNEQLLLPERVFSVLIDPSLTQ
jgi:hypothetical protein